MDVYCIWSYNTIEDLCI